MFCQFERKNGIDTYSNIVLFHKCYTVILERQFLTFHVFFYFITDFSPHFPNPKLNQTVYSPTATPPADFRRWQTRDSSISREAYS